MSATHDRDYEDFADEGAVERARRRGGLKGKGWYPPQGVHIPKA